MAKASKVKLRQAELRITNSHSETVTMHWLPAKTRPTDEIIHSGRKWRIEKLYDVLVEFEL